MTEVNPIEQEIQDKGLTAPRVTPEDIEANIASEHYFTAYEGVYGRMSAVFNGADPASLHSVIPAELKLLTFCVLVLRNGFTVTGESACVSPENYDQVVGYRVARQNALDKIWPLMGYALKSNLYGGQGHD